jgi:hypothetical protein
MVCDSWSAFDSRNQMYFHYCYSVPHSLLKLSRLCGLVVRVSGYRSRRPGFDSRPYQIL